MAIAKNLPEMKKALSQLQLMMQNIMIGTVDGRTSTTFATAACRSAPRGLTTSGPCRAILPKPNGKASTKFEDLMQLTNPPQGYMQNCNVSPQFLMKDCPLQPLADNAYLFNGFAASTMLTTIRFISARPCAWNCCTRPNG